MKIMEKPTARTIKASAVRYGDVVGEFSNGVMNYYISGCDSKTGDDTFTNLSTGQVIRVNEEKEFYSFPDANFSPFNRK